MNVCDPSANILQFCSRNCFSRERTIARNRKNENCEKSYHGAGIKFFPRNSLFFSRVMVILTRFALTRPAGGGSCNITDASKARARFWSPERTKISFHVLHIPRPLISLPPFFVLLVPALLSHESQMIHICRL